MNKPLALLTGVGRAVGITAGIARQLATDGWDLALNYWAPYDERMQWGAVPSGFEELVDELSGRGAKVLPLPGDLESVGTPGALFRSIAEARIVASALVLGHCESVDSNILDTTVESFDRHYAVNVRSSWQLIREFALQVPLSGGRIVALTSDAVIDNIPYGATKAGLDRIVLASARELADRKIIANVQSRTNRYWLDERGGSTILFSAPADWNAWHARRYRQLRQLSVVRAWGLGQRTASQMRWRLFCLSCTTHTSRKRGISSRLH